MLLYDYVYKIAIVGSSRVGKTTCCRIAAGMMPELNYTQTIGVDFYSFITQDKNNKKIKCHLWDLGGAPIYQTIVQSYLTKQTSGLILMFDLSKSHTVESIYKWYDIWNAQEKEHVGRPVIIAATKTNDNVEFDDTFIKDFAHQKNIPYLIISDTTCASIYKMINTIVDAITDWKNHSAQLPASIIDSKTHLLYNEQYRNRNRDGKCLECSCIIQ